MHWFFLLPLIVALVAGYISQKSNDEICYLTGTLTALSLVLSLFLAPWEFQVLILILALVAARQFWFQIDARLQPELNLAETSVDPKNEETVEGQEPAVSSHPNTRTYRGVSYESNSLAIAQSLAHSEGKYRGSPCSVGNQPTIAVKSSQFSLKYRGIKLGAASKNEHPRVTPDRDPKEDDKI